MKAISSEMILTVGILVAVGILLLQLKGFSSSQIRLSQEEVVSVFIDDIKNIIDNIASFTGNATFVYYPDIKKYTLTVKNNTVLIYDKISKKTASFTRTNINLQDIIFEDSEIIYIKKVEDNIFIMEKI